MPLSVSADVRGDRRVVAAFDQVRDPRVISAALVTAAKEVKAKMILEVSGPRPRRLDAVSGQLRGSFQTDGSKLPDSIQVGTPLFWASLWEAGKGRRRKRPFGQPAFDLAVARLPDIVVGELERATTQVSDKGRKR